MSVNKIIDYLLVISFLISTYALIGQPVNDNCWNPIEISATNQLYCTPVGAHTLLNATNSGYAAPSCWSDNSRDVWFSFVASALDVRIVISGATSQSPRGTLSNPEVALYEGICGGIINQLKCFSDNDNKDIIELFHAGLTIGQTYLIRVKGQNNNIGTFSLCLINTNPVPKTESDCTSSVVLCDKSTIVIESVSSGGKDLTELDDVPCLKGFGANNEQQTAWVRWTAQTSGTLTFTLTPLNPIDDIDFAVFELPGGIDDCANKIHLRCMFAGESVDRFPSACHGPTGLSMTETDLQEPPGCDMGQNNFVRFLDVVAGKSYSLGINNFTTSNSGFIMEWGGTAEFLGPEADFDIDPMTGLKCEQTFRVTDKSTFSNGTIVNKTWNFGKDARPPSGTGDGPFDVDYVSFGDKYLSLTVESDRGCIITKTIKIFVEPCCEDLPDLEFGKTELLDLVCAGVPEGEIRTSGLGGTPMYEYSLDDKNYRPVGRFDRLQGGDYTLYIRDSKGCLFDTTLIIDEPEIIEVDAGEDVTIILGECFDLNAISNRFDNEISKLWTGSNIDCETCLSTEVCPTKDGSYVIVVRDSSGCKAIDSLRIKINIVRPFYAPNVISNNGDGINDRFTIFGGLGLSEIENLRIYDRWGNLVFEGNQLEPGNLLQGWDGKFQGEDMNPGVFVWVANLKYIDDAVIKSAGDLTLLGY